MHRTQLSLEDWQYETLKSRAEREGRSISQLVREILAGHLKQTPKRTDDRLAKIEGIGEDKEASGREHDRYLYGSPGSL